MAKRELINLVAARAVHTDLIITNRGLLKVYNKFHSSISSNGSPLDISDKIYIYVSRERVRNGKMKAHKSGRRPSSAHWFQHNENIIKSSIGAFPQMVPPPPLNISARIYINVSRKRVRNGKMRAQKSGCRPSSAHCLSIINRELWEVFKNFTDHISSNGFPLNIHINFSIKRRSKKC